MIEYVNFLGKDKQVAQFIFGEFNRLMGNKRIDMWIKIENKRFDYPITCPKRMNVGQKEDYIIILPFEPFHWSQLIYQYAHELGHFYMDCYPENTKVKWISECLCELMSIIFLKRANKFLSEFAPSFVGLNAKYFDEHLKKSKNYSDISCNEFVAMHFEDLVTDPTEEHTNGRPRNCYIAYKLFCEVGYSGLGLSAILLFPKIGNVDSSEEFVANWLNLCVTLDEKQFVQKAKKVLGL